MANQSRGCTENIAAVQFLLLKNFHNVLNVSTSWRISNKNFHPYEIQLTQELIIIKAELILF